MSKEMREVKESRKERKEKKTERKEKKVTHSKRDEKLLFDTDATWWQVKMKTAWSMASQAKPIPADILNGRISRAQSLLATQSTLYERLNPLSPTDRQWLESVEVGGTASDRVSSLLVRLREAPVIRAQACLSKLLELARVPARHQAQLALDALLEAFQTLLPAGRPLVSLKQKAFEGAEPSDKELLICLLEDTLKRHFLDYVRLLEIQAQDQILHSRQQACRHLWQIGMHTREQQANILRLLANKLGDSDRQLASRQLYYLQEIVNSRTDDPDVSLHAVDAVRTVIMRPGVGEKALYYGCLFLSQLTLSTSQPRLTAALMEVYVSLFKAWVIPSLQTQLKEQKSKKKKKRGKKVKPEIEDEHHLNNPERLAKAVVTGLHRAIPFWREGEGSKLIDSLTAPLHQLIKGPSLACAIQALTLLWTLCQALKQPSEMVIDPLLALLSDPVRLNRESSSHASLMALILRIMAESSTPSYKLIKACLRSCVTATSPAWIGACILMVSELDRTVSQSLLTLTPDLPTGNVKSFLQDATEGCAYELCWMVDHPIPWISNWATAVLKGGVVRLGEGPFAMLTPTRILDQLLQSKEENVSKKSEPAVRVKRKAEREDEFSDYFSESNGDDDVVSDGLSD